MCATGKTKGMLISASLLPRPNATLMGVGSFIPQWAHLALGIPARYGAPLVTNGHNLKTPKP